MRKIVFLIAALLLPLNSQAQNIALQGNRYVKTELVANQIGFQPAVQHDKTIGALGVRFNISPGWHIYWKKSGDAGMPTEIQWQLPHGWAAGPLHWPAPKDFSERGKIHTLGMTGEVLLYSDIFAPVEEQIQNIDKTFRAKVRFLVCNKLCVPGEANVELTLPYSSTLPQEQSASLPLFQRTRAEELRQGNSDSAPTDTAAEPAVSIWFSLLCAFAAGFILNFMPCVLPVVSLKTMSVIEARGHSKADRLRDALAFSCGVLSSFGALAVIISALRLFSIEVKWGFQFQNPIFVGVLALVVTFLGLGFFDLYTARLPFIGKLQRLQPQFKSRPASEFFDGVLITLLSTPCTAPFLGTALLVAFTQSAAVTFLIFLSIGLGLALPFVLIITQPRLMRLIPKPGEWMNTLKKFFGVLMLGTAVWLFWVFAALISQNKDQMHQSSRLTWTPYNDVAVMEAVAQGQTVFIDFSAEWCVTCKFNENFVLNTEDVQEFFEQKSIKLFKADFTARDAVISNALSMYGGHGVPHYVVLKPGQAPKTLPPILTESIVRKALE